MAFFQNNFWGEKNAGFDVLYHNMKHGQLATKELAEFVRESAAIEETYSKSMSKLAKMASNGSPQGTFAPMWDVFRVSSDKLALCHLELMRKMNDLIRDINKYGDEQVKIHRKTKEEMAGTVEAVQALQVQSGHLQKSKEGYHAKCLELDRLRKEGGPQKELEKAELKSKKAAESFALCIEKYNRVGGEFEQKMSESAQKFQEIEEAHLRQMKQLIKGYSHSIEDTHVQVGQVHEEFKQNVENIGIDNLIQKFAELKGTGKDRPALVGFDEYMTAFAPEGGKKSRVKTFRIPGLGKRDKEPDSTDSAVTDALDFRCCQKATTQTDVEEEGEQQVLNSPLEVDDEGFVIRADSAQNGCSEEKENNFYSSDSDFDDEEPKKFHIQIRPVASSNRSNSAATEKELKATVGALTLPPNRGERQKVSVKRHLSRNSSTAGGRSEEGESFSTRDGEQEGLRRSTSSPDHSRLSSTASGSDSLFGPPLESAFKSKSFDSREQLVEHSAFGASEYAAFSSDSSSPENVEDSGLDSPSHQTLGPSPEPVGWAAWPPVSQSKEQTQTLGRPADPFLTAFRDPSPGRSPHPQDDPASIWSVAPSRSSRVPQDMDPTSMRFPAFSQSLPPPEMESSVWNCKHIPPEDPFLAAFERTVTQDNLNLSDAWARPPPRPTQEVRGMEVRGDPFSMTLADTKTLPTSSSSSSSSCSNRKDRDRKRDRSLPPPVSSDDPFAITMIGSPTHQSSLAAAAGLIPPQSGSGGGVSTISNRLGLDANSSSLPTAQPKKELMHWNSVHNPFSDGASGTLGRSKTQEGGGKGDGAGERRKHRSSESEPRRNAPPLTRHSGPQEDLCFSTDKDQDCLDLNTQITCGSHKGSKPNFRQDTTEAVAAAPPRAARAKRTSGRLSGCERSRSLCSSPLPEPSPSLTSSSSSSPSEWGPQVRENDWGGQNRAPSPARVGQASPLPYQDHQQRPLHLSRGPSPISLSTQEAWPVAAAITEYINAYFKGGQHNRCLVKITGDLTMSFPAGITRIFTANPNVPVLSFRLVNISRIDHFLPNQKLLYSDPSQSDPDTRDFWFNMQALQLYLQREAELNPQASYYNVGLLKYQVSSQDPGRAPLLLSAECQRSGTVTRVSLDYHCCPATAPSTQLTAVQVLLPLDHTATDLQCQPPASWNAEERRLLWKLPNISPTNHSKGSGTLCASWQCLEVPRGPPPSLAVQFVGSGASLSGMSVELVGSRYRMSLVKKRFATGKYMAGCSL
ncbi:F-BAR domain only protein 1 isoform X1 [Micropterus salmoides]|uniref:F-BAR domain only protein 1 isoform X1 n=1 Tax=Micropterus salmoides TaxID=27706 RepID=UPI0018EC3509|nr:F-BAR domain only protein 1 isoform X1 [Micropterus salmoides]XP_038571307.1 F-BAR domain only protein 1 isoform X1 [Micropterus salmoides]XP_038571308.1 F-BAR domain only protein 1 isoform X1 [Micropterus salmoides]